MKPNFSWCWLLGAAVACLGTETGNPPTRSSCSAAVCGPCTPPIALHVTDAATGAAVTDLSVNDEPASCFARPLYAECHLDGAPYTSPGVHTLELSAPGYRALSLEVEVTGRAGKDCCSCGYTPIQVDVALAPSPPID